MHFQTDDTLEDFILNTRWEDLPEAVQQRMKGCFVDLMGAPSFRRSASPGVRLTKISAWVGCGINSCALRDLVSVRTGRHSCWN